MKRVKLLLFASLLVVGATGHTQERELVASSGEFKVRVTVSDARQCRDPSAWRWGAENKCPPSAVTVVRATLKGEPVFVPLSAFADLGDPRDVRIARSRSSDRYTVVIIGGDAATSYSAKLEFRQGLLYERVVPARRISGPGVGTHAL